MSAQSPASRPVSHARLPSTIPSAFFDHDEKSDGTKKWSPAVMSYIRDDWIASQMREREVEYTEYLPTRIFVGTWNVNGKAATESLASWLGGPMVSGGSVPDVYVVGFQEIVDLTATSVVISNQSNKRSTQWCQELQHALNPSTQQDPDERFQLVDSRNLVGILICVFAKKKLAPMITDIQGTTAGVGMLGVLGNKGAAAIRFQLYDSTFCFTCSHLAAHRGNVAGRNSDFASILSKVEFRNEALSHSLPGTPAGLEREDTFGILDHDFSIWLGDLNYRIEEAIPKDVVMERAKGGQTEWDTLLERDQLLVEKAAGRTFLDFLEGPIRFAPTYKYQTGTDVYDERPDKKIRAPAWCDRILWRSILYPRSIRQLYYGRTEQRMSDHKPVHALFEVAVKSIIHDRKTKVYRDIMRRLDAFENSMMPKIELTNPILNFGDIVYKTAARQTLTAKNIGETPAQIRFVPKLEDRMFCRPWLGVAPSYGMLLPGESMTIELEVFVDESVARDISLGREDLNEVLILRVERGQDFFVAVSGNPLPSCFGCSLPQLASRPGPIRECGAWDEGSSCSSDPPKMVSPVPKELWRLFDAIFHGDGLDHPGLFVVAGPEEEISEIRECLDTGTDFPPSLSPLSYASVVLEFLTALRDPVIPCAFFPLTDFKAVPLMPWITHMMRTIPALNYNCVMYVVAFLKEVLARSDANGVSEGALIRVFSRAIIRKLPHEDASFHASSALTSPPSATTASSAAGGLGSSSGAAAGAGPGAAAGSGPSSVGGDSSMGAAEGGAGGRPEVAGVAVSSFADPGTRWEPTALEQTHMDSIMQTLLRHTDEVGV